MTALFRGMPGVSNASAHCSIGKHHGAPERPAAIAAKRELYSLGQLLFAFAKAALQGAGGHNDGVFVDRV
jgi:hypothetical protein